MTFSGPRDPRALLRRYHDRELDLSDEELDRALGLAAEETISTREALRRYGHHRLSRQDTPYALIRDLYSDLAPENRAHILDLGCGYGRIGFYGALLFGCRYTGIEIVAERVEVASTARARLGDLELALTAGDALAEPWPTCTCVCLMNSFLPSLLPAAIRRLRAHVAATGAVTAAVSTAAVMLNQQPDLREEIPPGRRPAPYTSVRIFAPSH